MHHTIVSLLFLNPNIGFHKKIRSLANKLRYKKPTCPVKAILAPIHTLWASPLQPTQHPKLRKDCTSCGLLLTMWPSVCSQFYGRGNMDAILTLNGRQSSLRAPSQVTYTVNIAFAQIFGCTDVWRKNTILDDYLLIATSPHEAESFLRS